MAESDGIAKEHSGKDEIIQPDFDSLARDPEPDTACPTPPRDYPAEAGEWTLISPSGKRWTAESPLCAVRAEINERVPAVVQLERIFSALTDDSDGEAAAPCNCLPSVCMSVAGCTQPWINNPEVRPPSAEPVLPCNLVVGNGTFHKGVRVSLAQGCINRLAAECRRLQETYEPLSDEQKALFSELRREPAASAEGTPETDALSLWIIEAMHNTNERERQDSVLDHVKTALDKSRHFERDRNCLQRENEELRAADRDHLAAKNGMEKRLTERAETAERDLAAMKKAQSDAAEGLPQ